MTKSNPILVRVAALVVLCSQWLVPTLANAARDFEFGACIHVGQNMMGHDEAVMLLQQTKMKSFRDEVLWSRVELAKGELIIPAKLADLDRLVSVTAVEKGLRPLIILGYGNRLYDSGEPPRTPEARAAFVRYAKFVASRYRRQDVTIEIWNEWNGGMGSQKRPRPKGSVTDYLAILETAVPAIKAVAPNAKILAGATAHIDLDWSVEFAQRGGLALVDGFSIHPYNYNHPQRSTAEDAIVGLQNLQRQMAAAAGVAEVPFYLTEMGVPSRGSAFGDDESKIAAYAARFILLARAQPFIRGVWWYELRDGGFGSNNPEMNFGIYDKNRAPKAISPLFSQLAEIVMEGRDFVTTTNSGITSVTWTDVLGGKLMAAWGIKRRENIPGGLLSYMGQLGDTRTTVSGTARPSTLSFPWGDETPSLWTVVEVGAGKLVE